MKHLLKKMLLTLVYAASITFPLGAQGLFFDEALFEAVEMGNTAAVAKILKQLTTQELQAIKDDTAYTPLHGSSSAGYYDITALLLDHGADKNAQESKSCFTPLHYAALRGHRDIVALLLLYGADPDIPDNEGCTPLHCAAYEGHIGVVQVLLKYGANVNSQDHQGETPSDYARALGHTAIERLLKLHGAR